MYLINGIKVIEILWINFLLKMWRKLFLWIKKYNGLKSIIFKNGNVLLFSGKWNGKDVFIMVEWIDIKCLLVCWLFNV